jgi:putative thioredoxin
MAITMGDAATKTPTAGWIKDSNTRGFMADVIEASRKVPVIVDFWAPWCGPCKQLGPALEKVVAAQRGAVQLVKINVDENQQLAAQMRIQSIPAVYAFVNGQPVDGFMGALPESQLAQFVSRLLAGAPGNGTAELLEAASAAAEAKDHAAAAQIYAELLELDRESLPAIAGLARARLATGDLDGARTTLALAPPAKAGDAELASVRALIDLATKATSAAPLDRMLEAVSREPSNHQARFDLALALNAAGRREEALDELVAIVRKDRAWNDEAARKQLVQFFDAWGPKDEMTIAGRRKLASVLFS